MPTTTTSGPWLVPLFRLVLSFAADDQPHVRHAALAVIRGLGCGEDFPGHLLPAAVATALLRQGKDVSSAFLAVAGAFEALEEEEEEEKSDGKAVDDDQDVFDKSPSNSWEEPSATRRQIGHVLKGWMTGSANDGLRQRFHAQWNRLVDVLEEEDDFERQFFAITLM